jgi:sulfoxide reductase heme-binding subunit YedZ
LWLGLGTLALDLVAVVVLTSLLRHRLPHRLWLVLHLTTYAAWAGSVAHGLGIGTDTGSGFATAVYLACTGAVGLAVLVRVGGLVAARRRAGRTPVEAPDGRPRLASGVR